MWPESAIDRDRRSLHSWTLGAAACALLSYLATVLRDTSPWISAGAVAVSLGGLAAGTLGLRRVARRFPRAPALSPIFVLLALVPWLWQGGIRAIGYDGSPLEVTLIASVLWLVSGLAAAGCWREFQPLAMLGGLFVVMFSATLWNGLPTQLATAAFALCGLAWLATGHWADLRSRMRERRHSTPRGMLGLPALLAVLLLAGLAAAGANRLWSLKGWMPSSGGDGSYDPSAMSGVGDGDSLVSGQENIQSFGPIEDAPFRSSDQPSLYDVFNDLYNEPVTPKNTDRSVALPPEYGGLPEQRMTRTERAAREFSTLRRKSSSTKKVGALRSEALLYVKGRVPLHLRLAVYDLFDGVTWYPADEPTREHRPRLVMNREGTRAWVMPASHHRALEFLGPTEPHALKIIHLDTNRIPAPQFLRGIHIDLVEDVEFYKWAESGLVALNRKQLPSLTTIHLRTKALDARRLAAEAFWGVESNRTTSVLPVGGEMNRLAELARNWTTGVPRGWKQIETLVARLRSECVHDREYKGDPDSSLPVADFLLRDKRGPDYQFATAAAVLLRSLGYSTRLVTGFHASPDRYDRAREHTTVLGQDAHAWVEVCLSGSAWIPLEPTPGFALLGPPPGWWERIIRGAQLALLALRSHWLAVSGLLITMLLAWRLRYELVDQAVTTWWRWHSPRSERTRLLSTLSLIELRCRFSHRARPKGCSPARWLETLAEWSPREREGFAEFTRLIDWSVFAPQTEHHPRRNGSIESLCREIVALCTRSRLRTANGTAVKSTMIVDRSAPRPQSPIVPLSIRLKRYATSLPARENPRTGAPAT